MQALPSDKNRNFDPDSDMHVYGSKQTPRLACMHAYGGSSMAVLQMIWARPQSLDVSKDVSDVEARLRKAHDAERAEDDEDAFLEEERLVEDRHRRDSLDRSTPSYRTSAAALVTA